MRLKQTSVKHLEVTQREDALNKSSLVSTNKGFSLMLKMGYQMGKSLGKADEMADTATTSKHLMEPIKVTIKADRAGLGQAEEQKQRLAEIEQYMKHMHENRSKFVANTTDLYLDNKRAQFQLRKLRHNLHKCQRVCFQLDSSSKVIIRDLA